MDRLVVLSASLVRATHSSAGLTVFNPVGGSGVIAHSHAAAASSRVYAAPLCRLSMVAQLVRTRARPSRAALPRARWTASCCRGVIGALARSPARSTAWARHGFAHDWSSAPLCTVASRVRPRPSLRCAPQPRARSSASFKHGDNGAVARRRAMAGCVLARALCWSMPSTVRLRAVPRKKWNRATRTRASTTASTSTSRGQPARSRAAQVRSMLPWSSRATRRSVATRVHRARTDCATRIHARVIA